jgi:hypothetical protein
MLSRQLLSLKQHDNNALLHCRRILPKQRHVNSHSVPSWQLLPFQRHDRCQPLSRRILFAV